MRAHLISLDDGQAVELTKDVVLVGRGENCDLQLAHKSVSKLHCLIVRADGLLMIRDLGSTNGTRVNGQRIRRAALLPNDHLHIAHLRYKVALGPAVVPLAPAQADGFTQALGASELAQLAKHPEPESLNNDSGDDLPRHVALRQNALPDVIDDPK